MMPPPNWQNTFQQGFRGVSQRFQSGAQQFQQMMQQGYSGAQNGFQNVASRASVAVRGYSTRFNNNQFSGGGGFSQMSSSNPQFGMGGLGNNNMNSQLMNGGGFNPPTKSNNMTGDDERGCSTKTLLGFLVIFVILAASGGGAGFLLALNEAKTNSVAFGAAGLGGAGNFSNADANPATAFNIELFFLSDVTDAERAAFEFARQRWQQVITTDLPLEAFLAKGRSICGVVIQEDIYIDDLLILVEIRDIDGARNILGSASPCGFDRANFPRLGFMEFDSADTAQLIADNQFAEVVLHEMGHVLGLGTLWDYPFQLLTPPVANNPTAEVRYLGTQGNLGSVAIGGPSQAIVENLGGPGTARGHWKDDVYQNELMTGFISAGVNPMSRMTVAALADFGYTVNQAAADSFVFPGRRLSESDGIQKNHKRRSEYGNDILNFPRHQLPTREKRSKNKFRADNWQWKHRVAQGAERKEKSE